MTVFKSITLRKEFAKHHCRTCGRVVCHACSPTKILSETTGKPERICAECLVDGGKARSKAMSAQQKIVEKEKVIAEEKRKEAEAKLKALGQACADGAVSGGGAADGSDSDS